MGWIGSAYGEVDKVRENKTNKGGRHESSQGGEQHRCRGKSRPDRKETDHEILCKKQTERCLKTWCLKTQVWYRTACWLCSSITEDKDQCTVGSAPQSVQQRMRQMHAKVQWIAHSPDHSVISSWAFEDYQFFYQFSVTVRANCPWKHHGCNSQTWKKHIKIMLIIRATDATVFNSSRYVPLQSSCCCSCCPFLSPIFAQYINS